MVWNITGPGAPCVAGRHKMGRVGDGAAEGMQYTELFP